MNTTRSRTSARPEDEAALYGGLLAVWASINLIALLFCWLPSKAVVTAVIAGLVGLGFGSWAAGVWLFIVAIVVWVAHLTGGPYERWFYGVVVNAVQKHTKLNPTGPPWACPWVPAGGYPYVQMDRGFLGPRPGCWLYGHSAAVHIYYAADVDQRVPMELLAYKDYRVYAECLQAIDRYPYDSWEPLLATVCNLLVDERPSAAALVVV